MNSNYGFFIKFSNNISHLKDLRDGSIYMNNGKFFIDLEKSNGIKGIGDKNEYNNIVHNVNLKILVSGTEEEIAEIENATLTTRLDKYLYSPIFCICLLEGDFIKEGLADNGKTFLRISSENLALGKLEKEFGKYAILISFDKFVERIENACEKLGYELARAQIKYCNYDVNDYERRKAYYTASNYGYFYKDEFYAHQLEYRFVITNKETEEPYILSIGSIEDISIIVDTCNLCKLAIAI